MVDPLKNGGSPLKPWKSIVFSEIKPLINNWTAKYVDDKKKKKTLSGLLLAVGPGPLWQNFIDRRICDKL